MKALAGRSNHPLFRRNRSNPLPDPDMVVQLYELLQGERNLLKIYSKRLNSEICLVNSALTDPLQLTPGCPVYTTEELAFILTLSEEELQRFHYLKTRLVEKE